MTLEEYRNTHLRLMLDEDYQWADELMQDAIDDGYTVEQITEDGDDTEPSEDAQGETP